MPNPTIFTTSNTRLLVWLRLANEARNATIHADAIRNYYMISEDMHGRPQPSAAPTAEIELKFIRDFVSHGEALRNCCLLAFIQQELGRPVDQYDPTDNDQQQFVHRQRQLARELIEGELNRLL